MSIHLNNISCALHNLLNTTRLIRIKLFNSIYTLRIFTMLCTFHNVYFIVIFKIIFNFEFSYYLLFFLRQITKKKKNCWNSWKQRLPLNHVRRESCRSAKRCTHFFQGIYCYDKPLSNANTVARGSCTEWLFYRVYVNWRIWYSWKKERERERTGIEGVITVSLLLLVSLEHGLYKGFQIRVRVMMQRCKR